MDSSEPLNQNPDPIQPHNFLVIRDDYFLHQSPVFPPTHHEDLPVPEPPPPPVLEASDESEPSSPAASVLPSRAVGEAIMRCCEILKAKVISRFRCSVLPVTAMAALLVLSLFWLKMKMKLRLRLPWRRRTVAVRRDNEERLLLLIKHKDEKISQLLLQIAQMNESLSARRRVPVVRIK